MERYSMLLVRKINIVNNEYISTVNYYQITKWCIFKQIQNNNKRSLKICIKTQKTLNKTKTNTERKMELEESESLTLDYTTKL